MEQREINCFMYAFRTVKPPRNRRNTPLVAMAAFMAHHTETKNAYSKKTPDNKHDDYLFHIRFHYIQK